MENNKIETLQTTQQTIQNQVKLKVMILESHQLKSHFQSF